MSVHVGACSDPVEIPGLAHFCEHMLFLGTELYPGEDSFSKFLSSNGELSMMMMIIRRIEEVVLEERECVCVCVFNHLHNFQLISSTLYFS